MKILFVQNAPCIRNYKMAAALRSHGHSVSLAYTVGKLSQLYQLSDDVYDECILARTSAHLWSIMEDYDIVHCHNEDDTLTIAAMAVHGTVIHDTHDLAALRPPVEIDVQTSEAIANRGAAGRVYSTPMQMETAHRLYGTDLDKSIVIYNYALAADIPEERLPKHDAGTHIVYEGGMGVDHRNYRKLFADLAQAGIHVHIYPNIPHPEYETFCKQYEYLHYNEPVSPNDIIGIMTQYDYGLVPFNITDENAAFLDTCIANKLFEYLAAGLPVIACNTKSLREFVEREKVGMVYESAEDIIANIDTLKDVQIGADKVSTMESQMPALIEFYQGLIDQPPAANVELTTPMLVEVINNISQREYEGQKFTWVNERPIEYRFVFDSLSCVDAISVLDVGSGNGLLPGLLRHCGFMVTGIDKGKDVVNRAFHVIQDDITKTALTDKFDVVTCISVLEHISDHNAAIKSMFGLLKAGGYLILTVYYNEDEYIDNVYKLPGAGYGQNYPYIAQVFSRNELDGWLAANDGEIVKQEYWQKYTGKLWTFGTPLNPPKLVDKDGLCQLTCLLIRKGKDAPVDIPVPVIHPGPVAEAVDKKPLEIVPAKPREIPEIKPVRRAVYHPIRDVRMQESQYWDADTMREYQERLLRDMIVHSYDKVPFFGHEMKARGLKPADIRTIEDLQKLPITSKRMMNDPTPGERLKFVAKNTLNWLPSLGETGGSTGEPFRYFISENQRDAVNAAVTRGFGWAGYKHGDTMVTMSGDGLGSPPELKLNTIGMNEEIMDGFIERIRELKPDGYRGLPYPMTLFCKHLARNSYADELVKEYAITTSENLLDDQREYIGEYLGEVFNQYGANDGGASAMECEVHSGLHIASEIAIFEVVDAEDNVLPPGCEGQLVVTSLYNYSMPWIRYRSNDVGMISTEACPCGRTLPLLINLQGRVTDFIVTDKATFSGTALCNAINHLPMRAYQFEQTKRNYIEVRIVKESSYSESDTEFIESVIRKYDPDVNLSFDYVDSIPQTPAGKSQYVIGLKEGV